MKRFLILTLIAVLLLSANGCTSQQDPQVAATTLPVYTLTSYLCKNTDISVVQLITENVSCLHDYTLQVSQMRTLEAVETVICSGAGLEDFMHDILTTGTDVIDASTGVELLCSQHTHEHSETEHTHAHDDDPHIWLSPLNAKTMANNIYNALCVRFPHHTKTMRDNLTALEAELDDLYAYGQTQLSSLSQREIITFHDGFAYFAQCFDLTILHAVEEESGSEASAAELIHLIELVSAYGVQAIFTETNGSTSAAGIIAAEANIPVFSLDMAMSGENYFDSMYKNIDTIKEALG